MYEMKEPSIKKLRQKIEIIVSTFLNLHEVCKTRSRVGCTKSNPDQLSG